MKQRGNILFLILLAVVLFAALSYAVTSSMRGGGNSSSTENAKLAASQIIQYSTGLQAVITRLRLVNQCDDTEISFQRDWNNDGVVSNTASDANNATAPLDKSCHIFDPAGGGLSYADPPLDALDTSQSAELYYAQYETFAMGQVEHIGTDCADDACADLLLFLRNITDGVCSAVNDAADISGSIVQGITNLGAARVMFTGVYRYINASSITTNDNLAGKTFGCMNHSASNENRFFMVLIAR